MVINTENKCKCLYELVDTKPPKASKIQFKKFRETIEPKLELFHKVVKSRSRIQPLRNEALNRIELAKDILLDFQKQKNYFVHGLELASGNELILHNNCNINKPIINIIRNYVEQYDNEKWEKQQLNNIPKSQQKIDEEWVEKNLFNFSKFLRTENCPHTSINFNHAQQANISTSQQNNIFSTNQQNTNTTMLSRVEADLIAKELYDSNYFALFDEMFKDNNKNLSSKELIEIVNPSTTDEQINIPTSQQPNITTPQQINTTTPQHNNMELVPFNKSPIKLTISRNRKMGSSTIKTAFSKAIKLNQDINLPFLDQPDQLQTDEDKIKLANYLETIAKELRKSCQSRKRKEPEPDLEPENTSQDEERIISHQSRGDVLKLKFEKRMITGSGGEKKITYDLDLEKAITTKEMETRKYFKNLEINKRKSFNPILAKYHSILIKFL